MPRPSPKSRALHLSDGARERVAARFRVLGEATRIKILDALFEGPASVNEILLLVGGTQANVSKHLALLHAEGLVSRRKEGTRAVYAIADPSVRRLCSIVCDAVEDEARRNVEKITRGG